MKRILLSISAVLSLGAMFAFIQLHDWRVTNDHSVKFSGKGVNGIFKSFEAVITFDEYNLADSKFVITIDVASLNTGNAMQNRHAISSEWFDATQYPTIKFTSTKIEKRGSSYVVNGKMEVKGRVKEVTIPFNFSKTESTGEFTSALMIRRSDYGVGPVTNDVSDEIRVELKVPVTKS